jgi:hypothetical protein
VNGVAHGLAFFPNLAILHIPYLSHMANVVFTDAVLNPLVSARIALLNEFVDDLRSPEGLAIVGRKCPTLGKPVAFMQLMCWISFFVIVMT